MGEQEDEQGRLLPGSVPGWGASWWTYEQGITKADFHAMTPGQRIQTMLRYRDAVNEGWEPPVPREQWVGPYHPSEPAD